jgi:membrane associated rhomboid family serine protease
MTGFLRETNEFFSRFMAPVTKRVFYVLAFSFIACFILAVLSRSVPAAAFLLDHLYLLTPAQAVLQANVWQFVTYIFAHYDPFHLLMNVLVLFFFGSLVENRMGGRRYLWLMLLSGAAGGVLHTIAGFALGRPDVSLLGFSGAAYAILTAAVMYFPRMTVNLYFLFPVPMRVMAVFFGIMLGFSIMSDMLAGGVFGGSVSHIAHLAGIFSAIVLIKVPGILDCFEDFRLPGQRRRPRKVSGRLGMGHPGRHTDPDDRYNDPHWYLDQ